MVQVEPLDFLREPLVVQVEPLVVQVGPLDFQREPLVGQVERSRYAAGLGD